MPLESKAVRNSDPHFDYGSHTTSASWCVTRAWGGHYCFGSCIIMGAKYQHGLGALLYKMGKTRATKNTQDTHNNQHERPPPYSPAACPPPLSMGRAKFSQIIAPLLPIRVCAGREPSGLRSPVSGERRGVALAVKLMTKKLEE